MKNSVGQQIAMEATMGFTLQATATPGFHSLFNWCCYIMWCCSGVPKDPENETVMEKHGAEALHSTMKSLMHTIGTKQE